MNHDSTNMRVEDYFKKNIDKVYLGQMFYLHFRDGWKEPKKFMVTDIDRYHKVVYLSPVDKNTWGGLSNSWNTTITVTPCVCRVGVFKDE